MGIKGLGKFLKSVKRHFQTDLRTIPITNFRNHRIVIDASHVSHRMLYRARQKIVKKTKLLIEDVDEGIVQQQWLLEMLEVIQKCRRYGIRPIFAFDGKPPKYKMDTIEDRESEREAVFERIRNLRMMMNYDPTMNNRDNMKELESLCGRDTTPDKEKKIKLKMLLDSLGIPWFQCTSEAEWLATGLVLEGHAAAVWSNDKDNLAHGCPILICEETAWVMDENGDNVPGLAVMFLHEALYTTQLSLPSFIDFCIMCGTDYGKNMPGIAAERSFPLIAQHRFIPALENTHDLSCLKWRSARHAFHRKPLESLMEPEGRYVPGQPFDLSIHQPAENIREIFSVLGLQDKVDTMIMAMRPEDPGLPGLPYMYSNIPIQPAPVWPLYVDGMLVEGQWFQPQEENPEDNIATGPLARMARMAEYYNYVNGINGAVNGAIFQLEDGIQCSSTSQTTSSHQTQASFYYGQTPYNQYNQYGQTGQVGQYNQYGQTGQTGQYGQYGQVGQDAAFSFD